MTKWQEIAKQNIHNRPAGQGRLAGKITIVTGAAQGFGKGIAEELYKEGATIIIADMNQTLAEEVAKEMGELLMFPMRKVLQIWLHRLLKNLAVWI